MNKNGILLINKPSGISSFQLIKKIQKQYDISKIGHAGTLDPFASGLLVVLLNKATKFSDLFLNQEKEYIVTTNILYSTDTLDKDGKELKKSKENKEFSQEKVTQLINKKYLGEIMQTPPQYSAIKINGKKMYENARQNKFIEIPERKINIKKIEIINFEKNKYTARVIASKGTYIRSLFYDINKEFNLFSHLSYLKRTKSGIFSIENAKEIDNLDIKNDLISVSSIASMLDIEILSTDSFDSKTMKLLENGNPIGINTNKELVLLVKDNKEIAIYKKNDYLYKCKIKF